MLEEGRREIKEIVKFDYLENENGFLDEIKSNFLKFVRAVLNNKNSGYKL